MLTSWIADDEIYSNYRPLAKGFRVVRANGREITLLAFFISKKIGRVTDWEKIKYLKWNRDGRKCAEGWRCKGCNAVVQRRKDYGTVNLYSWLLHQLRCESLQ